MKQIEKWTGLPVVDCRGKSYEEICRIIRLDFVSVDKLGGCDEKTQDESEAFKEVVYKDCPTNS